MAIPENVIQEIIRRANIEDIVGEYVSLTRKGDRLWGLSPFKTEKTPSFSVSPDKGLWYCFSTNQGGGVIQFVMLMEHLEFVDAVKFLSRKVGVELEDSPEASAEYRQTVALEDLNRRLAGSLHHLLLKSTKGIPALEYIKSRAISETTIEKFNLGYMPSDSSWLFSFLREKGYSEELLKKSGLFLLKFPKKTLFYNRLMFPISNINRQVVAFGGRILFGDGPKYLNSPETPIFHKGKNLYAIDLAKDAIKKNDTVVICEGYMDVIALHQGGCDFAVAPLGTAFTEDQAKLLRKLSSKIILLFDGDEAGIKATMKTLILAESLEFDCYVAIPEGAKDPAEILQRDGSQGIENLLNCKIHAFEYILGRLVNRQQVHNPDGKEQLVKEFSEYVKSIPSPVKKEAVVLMIADMVGLSTKTVFATINRNDKGPVKQGFGKIQATLSIKPEFSVAQNPRGDMEFRLMLAVLFNGEYFGLVRAQLNIDDLSDSRAREIWIALEEVFRKTSIIDFDTVLGGIESKELREHILRRHFENEFSENAEDFIRQGIFRMRYRATEQRRTYVEQTLKRLFHQEQQDPKALKELLEEKIILDQTLENLKENERSTQ